VLEQARAEGELEVELLKTQLKMLRDELKKARQPLDALEAIEEKIELVEEQVQEPIKRIRQTPSAGTKKSGALKTGDRVVLRQLGTEGILSAIDGEEAEVQAGSLRLRVRLDEIKRKDEGLSALSDQLSAGSGQRSAKKRPAETQSSGSSRSSSILSASPGMELDLRGQRAEDALDMLERYLEKAYMAGLPFVRIIHGKGTGKLRQEVRAALKGHPQVASFEEGGPKEGGEGVTVAKLASG
jgi:DNA mismatch repair protein MutS2